MTYLALDLPDLVVIVRVCKQHPYPLGARARPPVRQWPAGDHTMRRLTLPPTQKVPANTPVGGPAQASYRPAIQRHETAQNARFSTHPRMLHRQAVAVRPRQTSEPMPSYSRCESVRSINMYRCFAEGLKARARHSFIYRAAALLVF